MKRYALLTLSCLTGCVPYPIYKTLQPGAAISVRDDTGQPMAQAEVTLISGAYPTYRQGKFRQIQLTDMRGLASFDKRKQWQMQMLGQPAREAYFWNWCVRKEGYRTYTTDYGDGKAFQTPMVLRMEPGLSTPCPAPQPYGWYGVEM